MNRTSQKTFEPHMKAFEAGDLDTLVAGPAHDAIKATRNGPAAGKEAVRGIHEYYNFARLADLFALLEERRRSRSPESGFQEAGESWYTSREAVRGMCEHYSFARLADLFALLEKQRGSRSTEAGLQEAG